MAHEVGGNLYVHVSALIIPQREAARERGPGKQRQPPEGKGGQAVAAMTGGGGAAAGRGDGAAVVAGGGSGGPIVAQTFWFAFSAAAP